MKTKFDRRVAIQAAKEAVDAIKPFCVTLIVAGSLRRRKLTVGDVEILYIPILTEVRDGLFDNKLENQANLALEKLIAAGVIEKRKNVNGSEIWGEKIKLARHVRTKVPIDFFQTDGAAWHNYLVCRTGPAESNIRIAAAAKRLGMRWNPFASGFTLADGRNLPVASERDVFRIVKLPFKEPHLR